MYVSVPKRMYGLQIMYCAHGTINPVLTTSLFPPQHSQTLHICQNTQIYFSSYAIPHIRLLEFLSAIFVLFSYWAQGTITAFETAPLMSHSCNLEVYFSHNKTVIISYKLHLNLYCISWVKKYSTILSISLALNYRSFNWTSLLFSMAIRLLDNSMQWSV